MNHEDIYSKDIIEFVTVGAEFVKFLEKADDFNKKDYMSKLLKLLPLLYLKTSLIDVPSKKLGDEEFLETFVNETEYEVLRSRLSIKLSSSDTYCDNEEGETATKDISEDLADIYQSLRNFLYRFQIGNEDIMNDALFELADDFKSYWGNRLTSALNALHRAFYDPDTDFDEEKESENAEENSSEGSNKNTFDKFMDHQRK